MSATQNLAYSLVQVAHNFGAVAAVGGSLAAVRLQRLGDRRKLAWVALAGWTTQGASGAAFGAISYYFYHQFPDIAGIAVTALVIKIFCATAGFSLLTLYLTRGSNWTDTRINAILLASSILAISALSAAAFLRWFS